MSQQINLINPALLPRLDILGARVVFPVAVAVLCLLVALAAETRFSAGRLAGEEALAAGELQALQTRLAALAQAAANRRSDPALLAEIEALSAAVASRREALNVLNRGDLGGSEGVAEYFRALARQRLDGVWLTGFGIQGGNIEIRGRLSDPSLLPAYIRRLEGEPVFAGKRFEALNMQGVAARTLELPPPPAAANAPAQPRPEPVRRTVPAFTEFALQSVRSVDKPQEGRP